MDYFVELYDIDGNKTYNFRQKSAIEAFRNLGELTQIEGMYPFVTATCYYNQKVVWEVEFKC